MSRLHRAAQLAIARVIARFLILASIALLPPTPASGQATQASISGVVTDTSNAVLPGVTVAATGPALQRQVVAVSNEGGEYRLSPLPPGTYTITFELPGFQSVKREGVRLARRLHCHDRPEPQPGIGGGDDHRIRSVAVG